jgi:TPR repeat protein
LTPEDDNQQQVVTDFAVAAADRALRAAAATVGQMPDRGLQDRLNQLKRARASRTPREVLRQQAELDSLELDQAAYQLASQAHTDGNLPEAARWYRVAAINDFADAPFKLATVLDALAAKYLARPDMREERGLVTEAANWYLMAFLAGDLEGLDPLDGLIARLDEQADMSLTTTDDDPYSHVCALGGLKSVAQLRLAEATAHCSSCPSCKAELIKLRTLMGVLRDQPTTETADTHDDTNDSNWEPRRPSSESSPALHPDPSNPARDQSAGSPQHSGKKG